MPSFYEQIERYFSIPIYDKVSQTNFVIEILQTYGTDTGYMDAEGQPIYSLPAFMQNEPPNNRVQYYLFAISQGKDVPEEHIPSVIQGIQGVLIGLLNENAQMNYLMNLMFRIQNYYADKNATVEYALNVSFLLSFVNSLISQLIQGAMFSIQHFPIVQSEVEKITRLQQENEQLKAQIEAQSTTNSPKINLNVDETTAAFIFKLLRLYSKSAINHDNLHAIFQIHGQDITKNQTKNLQRNLSKLRKKAFETTLEKPLDFQAIHTDFLQALTESDQRIFSDLKNIFRDIQQGIYKK
jgi:hypothetical protein